MAINLASWFQLKFWYASVDFQFLSLLYLLNRSIRVHLAKRGPAACINLRYDKMFMG